MRFLPIPEPPGYSRLIEDPAALPRRAKYLDDLIRARHSFVAVQDSILDKLARGELSLPQACDRVYESATEIYPRSLVFLRKAAGNMPLKKKMACTLVDYLRSDANDTPSLLEVVSRLKEERNSKPFQAWCEQPWAGEPHP
jgi:hypothetical protein